MDRNKDLSFEERRIAELIGTLKSVDAPGDFNARVRARIATRSVSTTRSSWRPLAAGLAAAVLIGGGYVGYRSMQPALTAVTIESRPQANSAPTVNVQTVEPASRPAPEAPVQTGETAVSQKQPTGRRTVTPQATGGSIDEALKETRRFEPSLGGRPTVGGGDVRSMGAGEISVTSVLSIIGADASWDGGGWHVSSVRNHSVADRASLKSGDVIEAIDGRPLTATSKFVGRFDGKSLRVRRDGATLELALRP